MKKVNRDGSRLNDTGGDCSHNKQAVKINRQRRKSIQAKQ